MKKGPLFEKRAVQYLRENGFPSAERRVMGGSQDKGDVGGVPGVCIEVKNTTALRLGEYMNEVTKEAHNCKAETKAVVVNRRNHGIERAFVIMEFQDYVRLLPKP